MADDAGALLVRSGLVESSALDAARLASEDTGGTIGEALVHAGAISDDELTDFYCSRLLVPKVNPNSLARLSAKVVAVIPADMAVELRAIPVSLDAENNLTVAMSDPSDRHAVDEIAFFTNAYVVRAVATQMQIAWCLAHYYGHVTALGQRLLSPQQAAAQPAPAPAPEPTPASSGKIPRTKGLTGKVEASRHKRIAPIDNPTLVQRPNSAVLDDPTPAPPKPEPATPAPSDGTPLGPRPRTASGEIRVPRAPSVREPLPEDESGPVIVMEAASEASGPIETSGPVIEMEASEPDPDETPLPPPEPVEKPRPVRKRPIVKEDPPELAAKAGEIGFKPPRAPTIERNDDEPSILIDQGALEPPELADKTGEIDIRETKKRRSEPANTVEIDPEMSDDDDTGRVKLPAADAESAPILLAERKRPSDPPPDHQVPDNAASFADDNLGDTHHDEIVVLTPKAPKLGAPPTKTQKREARRTQMGLIPHAAITRAARDTETGMAVPDGDDAIPKQMSEADAPPTMQMSAVELDAAIPNRKSQPAVPAAPAAPAATTTTTAATAPAAPEVPARVTKVGMAAVADPVPPRTTTPSISKAPIAAKLEVSALAAEAAKTSAAATTAAANKKPIEYDPVDDGWGPPGTTIPPPLLGAVPGSDDDDEDDDGDDHHPPAGGEIPVSNVHKAPLIVTPPVAPEPVVRGGAVLEASGQTLVRALEDATSRAIELIRKLEAAKDRNDVVDLLIGHLAESHQRAGFFAIKGGELALFAVTPKPASLPFASLRLDRPSTLQDVVGTRLPYRGPMHDAASRMFLASVLGDSPPEILLVPITIRERVVGVLFGEHRLRHTFDDQLALAARAAGMSLERILQKKKT